MAEVKFQIADREFNIGRINLKRAESLDEQFKDLWASISEDTPNTVIFSGILDLLRALVAPVDFEYIENEATREELADAARAVWHACVPVQAVFLANPAVNLQMKMAALSGRSDLLERLKD